LFQDVWQVLEIRSIPLKINKICVPFNPTGMHPQPMLSTATAGFQKKRKPGIATS